MLYSVVDLTNRDSLDSHPSVLDAPYSEYVLGPGEMLFIPRWHWHLVLAVDETTARRWRKKHLREEIDQTSETTILGDDSRPQYAASVSLWWGSRLEKPETECRFEQQQWR